MAATIYEKRAMRDYTKEAINVIPSGYWGFYENFTKLPRLTATLSTLIAADADQRVLMGANQNFQLSGTNAANAGVTFSAGGGITLATAGANNDQTIIAPGLLTGSVAWTSLATAAFDPAKQPQYDTIIETAASVAALRVMSGLRLTAVADETTDNDLCMFTFNPAVSAKWRLIYNVAGGGVTTLTDSNQPDVAASTRYHLRVIVDSDRRGAVYIKHGNAAFGYVGKTPPLTSAAVLIPVYAVHALTGAAKGMTIRESRVMRKL